MAVALEVHTELMTEARKEARSDTVRIV